MRILVTGINGFIGQHLAKTLVLKGYNVVGLGRKETCSVKSAHNYFCGNILDKRLVKKAMDGVDTVVHLAAVTTHKDMIENKFETFEINFQGTKNILDILPKSSVKKLIYSSTGKVYGTIKSLPITEEHPTLPLSILGKSKLITEKLIDFYSLRHPTFLLQKY